MPTTPQPDPTDNLPYEELGDWELLDLMDRRIAYAQDHQEECGLTQGDAPEDEG